jgi:hypothetical protein
MFRLLCAILRELLCTFRVTYQFGFLVDKILCSMWLCVCYVATCLVHIDLPVNAAALTGRSILTRYIAT